MIQHQTTDHAPADHRTNFRLDPGQWSTGRNSIAFAALAGWIIVLAGLLFDQRQFFISYLTGFTFCITILLAAMFFLMVQHLTGSAWSVTIRRLEESLIVTMPLVGVLFIPVLIGQHHLYHWSHHEVVANDPLLSGKASFLNTQAFTIRAVAFFAIWSLWAYMLHRNSVRQDTSANPIQQMNAMSRWSAPGLLVLVLSGTLASFDWIMSLDPHWYSTIFGLYCLSGGGQAFWAALILICLGLRRANILTREITEEHYHDLGKWLFALTVFWAYIGFSQYLLIWYANIPEETIFFRHRLHGSWTWWSGLLLFGRFIIPFLVLLPRGSKRNLKLLGSMCVWILFVHFVDHYWMIAPNFHDAGVSLHWLDAAAVLAIGSTIGLAFWSRLKDRSIVPAGDPRLEQGLHFHNA